MAKKCIGCGVELQGEDKNKRGYLPQSVLDKEGGAVSYTHLTLPTKA